jgi:hypothetical protein
VTTAHSSAKPSTCSASFAKKLSGMSSGKYALTWPVALKRLPDGEALRADHHATAYRAVVRELRGLHHVEVPLRVVFRARLDVLRHDPSSAR